MKQLLLISVAFTLALVLSGCAVFSTAEETQQPAPPIGEQPTPIPQPIQEPTPVASQLIGTWHANTQMDIGLGLHNYDIYQLFYLDGTGRVKYVHGDWQIYTDFEWNASNGTATTTITNEDGTTISSSAPYSVVGDVMTMYADGLTLVFQRVTEIAESFPKANEITPSNEELAITGVFRRTHGLGSAGMGGNTRYYFHTDNTVELWHFGNRTLDGTYSISGNTVTLYRLDGSIERTLTISPDGQRLFGELTYYDKVSDTVPVFEEPTFVGRWELISTRGEFIPEELEFFYDGRMSSTIMRDGDLSTVWFYWVSPREGVLRYWRHDECESEAHEYLYTLFHWVTESELPGSRLVIRNLSGRISDEFQRIN